MCKILISINPEHVINIFNGSKNKAIAYKLDNIKKYDKPLDLSYMGVKNAPQSFIYV